MNSIWSCNETLTNLDDQQPLRNDPNRNLAMDPDQNCSHIYQSKLQKEQVVVQLKNIQLMGISRTSLCKSIQQDTICQSMQRKQRIFRI